MLPVRRRATPLPRIPPVPQPQTTDEQPLPEDQIPPAAASEGNYDAEPQNVDMEEEQALPFETYLANAPQTGLFPIQLHFENVSYAVPVKPKKDKLKWRRKKQTRTEPRYPKDVAQETAVEQAEQTLPSYTGATDRVTYQKKGKTYQYLLEGVSGHLNPGTMLAIMGSSGSGKTTLLNVLAGRTGRTGEVSGDILFNGNKFSKISDYKQIKKYVAYIMQDDLLLRTQTPKDILRFAALLRLPPGPNIRNDTDRIVRADKLLEELGLQRCQNTKVGQPGIMRGVSGGERKRVAIGNEIVNDPSILFVDEPTSGLDSYTAEQVMRLLRRIAKSGRIVVTTIHQPSSMIYGLFDQLMLLSNGKVVYYGPASEAITHFAELGYQCPRYVNPSDYFIDLIHIDPNEPVTKQRADYLVVSYPYSRVARYVKENTDIKLVPFEESKRIAEASIPDDLRGKNRKKAIKARERTYARSTLVQTKLLIKRTFTDTLREPLKVRASLAQVLIVALFVGLIFLQLGNDQADIQNRLGALFFVIVNQTFGPLNQIIQIFPQEKALFFREHTNNTYSATAFYFSRVIADFPFQVFFPLLFSTIVYWLVGFQTSFTRFLIFLAIIILVSNISSSLGLLISIFAKDVTVAAILVPLILLPLMIFGGFFFNTESIPPWFIWLAPLSFIQYAFSALVINEFEGLTFTCTTDQAIPGPTGELICPINTGEEVIQQYGFGDDTIAGNALILLGFYLGLRVAAYFALLWVAKRATVNA